MDQSSVSYSSATTMPTAASMSGMMASTFSSNTRVTLFFTAWKTSTPIAYVITLFFLFLLGILNRFLGAYKYQLEQQWRDEQEREFEDFVAHHKKHIHDEERSTTSIHTQRKKWNRTVQPTPPRLDEENTETQPLSPLPEGQRLHGGAKERRGKQRLWRPSAPLSVKRDGIRALLEFVRALIGYFL